jgi:hypothetical protein
MTPRLSVVSAVLLVGVLAVGAPAGAQTRSRLYAGASIGSFSVSADAVDGRSVAGGVFGGVALSKYIDAEIEFVLPASDFTRSYTGTSVSFAPPGASPAERERLSVVTRFDKAREVSSSLSAVVIFHPPATTRWTPGLIVGVSNQHVRDRALYTPLSIPEGVDPTNPSVIASSEDRSRNIGGPTFGANLAIALTPQLSIVPDVRYDYGSIGDEINNALRMSVRMSWRF